MLPRIANCVVLAVVAVAASVFRPDAACAQQSMPLQLSSLEWTVADSDVVVRGVVVEVIADENWNIVTLDVLETLKGARTSRLKFAAHKFARGDAQLTRAKQSKRELLWLLKRQDAGPGEAPEREKVLARHKIDLHAAFVPGRPGEPALPVIPLGPQRSEQDLQPPAFLSIDLRLLKTSDELVKAIRTAIADTQDQKPVRSYAVALPQHIAQGTGFSRAQNLNLLIVPVDRRLEEFARRLVQSPGDFAVKNDTDQKRLLRLEGVKALRLFPSEKNLATVRAWLDNPASTESFKDDRKNADLVPASPRNQPIQARLALPVKLSDVPEIHFQQPLTKAMKTEDAQLHTAVTIDSVNFLNRRKTDACIETLMSKRPDLAGLPFAMGDSCRMKPEAGKQFVAALDVFHKTESSLPSSGGFGGRPGGGGFGGGSGGGGFGAGGSNEQQVVTEQYQAQSAVQKIDPSASVAVLVQVLGPEDAKIRLGLVKYLNGLVHADATRALAKLAIFSAESEVRTEALTALKKREGKDCTAILLAGLKYPWPAVAEQSSAAIVELGRKDLIPHLIDILEKPDPRAPQIDKKVSLVRELVRVNHHHNCLLCHAPAPRRAFDGRNRPAGRVDGPDPRSQRINDGLFPFQQSRDSGAYRCNLSAPGLLDETPRCRRRSLAGAAALRFPGAHPCGDGRRGPRHSATSATESAPRRFSLSPCGLVGAACIDGDGHGADGHGMAEADGDLILAAAAKRVSPRARSFWAADDLHVSRDPFGGSGNRCKSAVAAFVRMRAHHAKTRILTNAATADLRALI